MDARITEKKGFSSDLNRMLREPSLVASLAVVIVLFVLFILYPLMKICIEPGWADWAEFFSDKQFIGALYNTILSSLLATLTAVLLGLGYSYAVNYTEIPGKAFFRFVVLLPLMAPSVISGLAFIMLFGRRGMITYHLLGMRVDLYGWVGLWAVQTLAFFPLAYMTISGVLRSISPNVELAAQNLGAHGWRLFRTVTFPLALPGILSAFLLVAINAFADFGNPILIGGNHHMLATEAYKQVTSAFNMPLAAVLSIVLLLPTLAVFLFQKYFLDRRSFVTITGKPVAGLTRITPGPLGSRLLFCLCAFVSGYILLTFGIVVLFALTVNFGFDYTFTIDNFTEVFFRSEAMRNSWVLSIIAAMITTLLGIFTAFLVSRKSFPGRGMVDFVALLPIAMPGTFMGLALVLAFNTWLAGTAAIIVIGLTLRQLPVGYRNAISAFKQIDKSIEEASTNLGANAPKTFRLVVLPMLKNAVSTSLVYSFLKNINTLSTVIFLFSPQWLLASYAILSLADHGYYGKASATALGMMLSIIVTFGVAKFFLRDRIRIFDL
ncbi:MAG: iron ABC transporter permease [Methylobacteriaceae bacterium]|jgi:iron(III) transport system permease protein|nr:iron ABC transporter permease [Methylobacteriaceae bacterium]